MPKLAQAEMRALKAVRHGDVTRVYDRKGNRFVVHENAATPRPSAAVLWRLERWKMLATGSGSDGVYASRCSVSLTPVGETAFKTGDRA